jgi:DNA-binding SARP family transcriptional activator
MEGVDYRLLGPLTVHGPDGARMDLGPPKQRAVLAVLLLHRGAVVPTERLVDAVWGDEAPPSALAGLQAYISNLRRALRADPGAASAIVRRAPGYVLDVPAEALDVVRFAGLARAAQAAAAAARWAEALETAEAALALWRGPLLADLADERWVQAEANGLEELRTECRETRVTALLAVGRLAEALAATQALWAEQPRRDRACWLHLVALHRAGRSPEALEAYREHAGRLDDELGLEPGSELRELQVAILRQDPAIAAWPRPPGWTGAVALEPAPAAAPGTPPAVEAGDRAAAGALVGRRREVEVIARSVADVRGGASRWLVFTGPAGIGKSRLAEELVRQVRGAGGRDVWARCPEDRGAPAWWAIRQLVRALGSDPDELLMPPAGVDPDGARFAVFERVREVVDAAGAAGPLALVVDDVQWADPTSARCLVHLADHVRVRPVLFALTLRDGEDDSAVAPLLAALARGDGNRQLAVPPLADGDVGALAEQVSGAPLGAGEARRLSERTGGNPLYVCEYARLSPEERAADAMPRAVRAVVGRRLAGLDPAVLGVLRAAAVIGDVLDLDLLATTTRLDLDELADLLDEAADEHVVVAAPGTAGYAFAHGLLREEVLHATPVLRRQRLHARVAEALVARGGPDTAAARAQHLLAAVPLVEPAEALAACREAARDAERRWSSEEAAEWWSAALGAHELLPAAARTPGERDDLLVARVRALAHAGRMQTVIDVVDAGLLDAVREERTSAAGRLAAALLRAAGAWPWATYGGDPGSLLARLAGIEPFVAGDPAALARVLAARAVGSTYDPDPAVPDALSRRALEIAEALGDPDVLADALLGRVITYSGVAGHAEASLALLARLGALGHATARVDRAIGHSVASMAALTLGDVDGAAEHVRLGIVDCDVLRLPIPRLQLRWMEGVLAQWRGDLDAADRAFSAAAEIHLRSELYTAGVGQLATHSLARERGTVAEEGDPAILPDLPVVWPAAVAAARGERERAVELLLRWLDASGPEVWLTLGTTTRAAEVVADLGATGPLAGAARRLVALLEPYAGCIASTGQVGVMGPVALALARLHAALGEPDPARIHLAAATALAERTGGRPSLARCRALARELEAAAA